jgi:hypothetical protein
MRILVAVDWSCKQGKINQFLVRPLSPSPWLLTVAWKVCVVVVSVVNKPYQRTLNASSAVSEAGADPAVLDQAGVDTILRMDR